MNLQFAEGFPGDSWVGAIGPDRFEFERANAPFEVDEVHGQALLRMTWRKRSEVPVAGQDKPQVVYSDEPVFALVEEAPAVAAESKKRGRKAEPPIVVGE